MQIHLPATVPMLKRAIRDRCFDAVERIGFAATEALQQEYIGADTEDLQYLALHDAALASLRLIAATDAEPVRVVLTVDSSAFTTVGERSSEQLPPGRRPRGVAARGDLDRAAVTVPAAVDWADIVAVRLDGGEVSEVIRAAAEAVDRADLGDADAAIAVGDAEDLDLAVYSPDEAEYLLQHLAP